MNLKNELTEANWELLKVKCCSSSFKVEKVLCEEKFSNDPCCRPGQRGTTGQLIFQTCVDPPEKCNCEEDTKPSKRNILKHFRRTRILGFNIFQTGVIAYNRLTWTIIIIISTAFTHYMPSYQRGGEWQSLVYI